MKKVIIVEDEMLAAKRLQRLLAGQEEAITVLAILDSVKNTARWLATNPPPDLVFMDIQLGDGLSFEVFEIVDVACPVIFITAFNEYALEAFKLNSIAYLLKPITPGDLQQALAKYGEMARLFTAARQQQQVAEIRKSLLDGYKKRFMVKVGDHIKSVNTGDIACFFSRDKATYIKTFAGRNLPVDYPLEQVQEMVDPLQFYRVNRKYLVNINAIEDIVAYTNSRLALHLPHPEDGPVIVSRERVAGFKQWLDR